MRGAVRELAALRIVGYSKEFSALDITSDRRNWSEATPTKMLLDLLYPNELSVSLSFLLLFWLAARRIGTIRALAAS